MERENVRNFRKVNLKFLDRYQDFLYSKARNLNRASQRHCLLGLNSFLKWMFGGRVATSIVKKYARKVGLHQEVTAHSIRHTMATHLVRKGAPLRYIQELLGHKYIISTQVYTRLVPEDLKRFHLKYHPRA